MSFEVGPAPDVEIRIASGHIHIEDGPSGTIGISISASDPDRLLVERFQDHIQIGQEGRLRGSYRIRLDVPAGTDFNTAVASGDIVARGPVGDFTARSASGDIDIGESSGRIEIKMASGDVTIDRAEGPIRVVSASGDVRVAEAHEDCSVATASGDIIVDTARGTVNLKTASGNANVRRFEGASLVASSVSGRLDLRIPSGRRVNLDIRTLSGRVDLPSPAASPPAAGAREVEIRAKSVSGNIGIDRA